MWAWVGCAHFNLTFNLEEEKICFNVSFVDDNFMKYLVFFRTILRYEIQLRIRYLFKMLPNPEYAFTYSVVVQKGDNNWKSKGGTIIYSGVVAS